MSKSSHDRAHEICGDGRRGFGRWGWFAARSAEGGVVLNHGDLEPYGTDHNIQAILEALKNPEVVEIKARRLVHVCTASLQAAKVRSSIVGLPQCHSLRA
ncbi:hypothetical protein F2Q68_00011640 [Brassica cretica]|uniref:Uncharacterized protein n=1 Tax=Brassica cretica TaxID=69181 RepID=A0A8S9KT54_BRACR|nr:hypothetical protein F2Q68_00011640 [Brassica cretica]